MSSWGLYACPSPDGQGMLLHVGPWGFYVGR